MDSASTASSSLSTSSLSTSSLSTSDKFVIIPAIAIDNLINRNRRRLPAVELPAVAAGLVGKPAITDHNTYSVSTEWAFVQSATTEWRTAPQGSSPSDLSPENQAIVQAEGYRVVTCDLAVNPDCPYLGDFANGLKHRVSITYRYTRMVCPGCTCGVQDLWHPKCPNMPYELPFIEQHGVTDALELSLVVVPAVPAARIVVAV